MTTFHEGDAVTVTSHCDHCGHDEFGRSCTVTEVGATDLPDTLTMLRLRDETGDEFIIWADEVKPEPVSSVPPDSG